MAGCFRVFTDKASGTLDQRKELAKVFDQLRPGDALVVWRLYRLGRSLRHLIETVTALADRNLETVTNRAVGYSTEWAVDADDSRKVTLDSLGLGPGERFCWAYDFFAGWSSTSGSQRSRPSLGRGSRACPAGGLRHQNGAAVMTGSGRGTTLTACRNTPSA